MATAKRATRTLTTVQLHSPLVACLWFDGQGDAAADFYISIFPHSRRTNGSEYPPDGPGEAGTSMVVNFELNGQPFMALNGGPMFSFTPAVSFVVSCADQSEVDYYWDRLAEGGTPSQCGWLADKFGLSWQIVPVQLGQLMSDPDPARAGRVMQAMLKMVKLDVALLEAAANASE